MKIDLNFDIDLMLAEADQLLGKGATYTEPYRQAICFVFLTDTEVDRDKIDDIMHGHPMTEQCYANSFCHHVDYRPKETDHPMFRKMFYRKWGHLYGNQ